MEFITQDDKKKLEAQLAHLKGKRESIRKRIGEARAQGDLSENAEYHSAREDQGINEAEVRRIEAQLKNAKVADDSVVPSDMAFLGSTVKLRDVATGAEELYKIVGAASGNFDSDEIEVTAQSPMGESLMKARVGDTIKVDLPRGTRRFAVVEVR
jgi:transcription elongation factor GreA